MNRSVFLICLIWVSFSVGPAISENRPDRVLFVGNSLTYYNDLPELVRQVSAAAGHVEFEVEMLAAAGVSVAQHLEAGRLSTILAEGDYSFVVFQDIGGWPICPPEFPGCSDSTASIEQISDLIRSNGAEPVWYSTYQPIPAVQGALSKEASRIASDSGIRIADVGAAWTHYEAIAGEGAPFLDDGHPNQLGSFIAAKTIFQAITDQIDASDIELGELCFREWQGTGLSAQTLASRQASLALKCETITPETQQQMLDAANKGFNPDAGEVGNRKPES